MDIEAACAYAEKHELHALIVAGHDGIRFERYANGYDADKAHPLYSGTKSFWGIAAMEAQREGVLHLDDVVLDTVTVRMLLQLTAGYGFGGLGSSVPTYEKAFATPIKTVPGEVFTYGGVPLQVFGGFFAERLRALGLTPHQYLQKRILAPANVFVASWRELRDGTHPLPTGAYLTARNWCNYGRFVLANHAKYAAAFVGSNANPRYGLGWWLRAPGAPDDLFYASGSAGQGLYLAPSDDIAIVHFAKSTSYKHEAFLKRFFSRAQ